MKKPLSFAVVVATLAVSLLAMGGPTATVATDPVCMKTEAAKTELMWPFNPTAFGFCLESSACVSQMELSRGAV
jgi:hypothetical protein